MTSDADSTGDPADSARRMAIRAVIARDGFRDVARVCASAGAVLAPLKGVLLASRYYRADGERPHQDLDALVAAEDRSQALRALEDHGWRVIATAAHATTLASPRSPFTLDLHTSLFPPGRFRLHADGVLARATRDESLFDAPILELAPRDAFAHAIGHYVHSRFGARSDWRHRDLIVLGPSLESPRAIAAHLERHGLRRAARYVLHDVLRFHQDATVRAILDELSGGAFDPVAGWLAERSFRGGTRKWTMPLSALFEDSVADAARFTLHHARDWPRIRRENRSLERPSP